MNSERLGTAAGLGAVTGLRSLVGLAGVSRELSDRRQLPRRASRLEEWLARDTVAIALSALALGELVWDKMPAAPDRVAPRSLLVRGLIGGTLGAVAAGPRDRAVGAALGVAAAVAASYAGWFLRREVRRATLVPDPAVALGEDAVAITAASELVKEL